MIGLAPKTRNVFFSLFLTAALAALISVAPSCRPSSVAPEFTTTRAMIPMRDGVRLYTIIFVPKKAAPPLPFLLMRTPLRRSRIRAAADGRALRGARRRGLHLRLPGHPRPVPLGRPLRDAAAAARQERSPSDR